MKKIDWLIWKLRRKSWHVFMPIVSFFFWRFLRDEQHLGRIGMGLREACWTYMCGYDVKFSLHLGNIWWRIGQ